MALTFLVDTSVIKRLDLADVRRVVEPLAIEGELGRAVICDLEVGYSARTTREWDHLIGALAIFQRAVRALDDIVRTNWLRGGMNQTVR